VSALSRARYALWLGLKTTLDLIGDNKMKFIIEQKVNEVASEIELLLNNMHKDGFSSENAFVFNFAWAMKEAFENVLEQVDFETRLFEDFSGGKFLDLLLKFRDNERPYLVGFEFKLPKWKKPSAPARCRWFYLWEYVPDVAFKESGSRVIAGY